MKENTVLTRCLIISDLSCSQSMLYIRLDGWLGLLLNGLRFINKSIERELVVWMLQCTFRQNFKFLQNINFGMLIKVSTNRYFMMSGQ